MVDAKGTPRGGQPAKAGRRKSHAGPGGPKARVHSRKPAGRGRKKKQGSGGFILGLFGAALLIAGAVFGALALKEEYPYIKAKAEYEKFRTEAAQPLPEDDPYDGLKPEEEVPAEAVEAYGEELLHRGMDWERIRYINQDIVAWITVPGTQIDYPVCAGEDNEYYISHNAYRDANALGAVFADCNSGLDSGHPILYGHNMEEGQMFGELSFYSSQAFWQSHPYVYVYTPEGCSRWAVASAFQTDDRDMLYVPGREPGTDKYAEMAEYLSALSLYPTGLEITKDTRVLTLSTCADYGYEGDRFTVHCVPAGTAGPGE